MDHGHLPSAAGGALRPRVLVLGGTAEARELASAIDGLGIAVVTSLAGRVRRPRLPPGDVRVGGFGGPQSMADWLRREAIAGVIDATHPFAERISASAAVACPMAGIPLLRLERPGWHEGPDDDWHWVADLDEAAGSIPRLGRRVLLTTGRQGLASFAPVDDAWFLVRCVDPPSTPLPAKHTLLLARGPYTYAGELSLIDIHRIDLLVTKDSGGDLTRAKLDAARDRGIPVIIVRRPRRPVLSEVATVEDATGWAQRLAQAG